MTAPPDFSVRLLAVRIGRQLSGLGVAAMAPTLISFVLWPIFSFHLTPADFGLWALLQVTGMIFSAVAGFGMLGAAPFYYTEEGAAETCRRKMANLLCGVTMINVVLLAFWASLGWPLLEWLFPHLAFELVMLSLAQAALLPYLDGPVVAWKMRERSTLVGAMSLLRVCMIGAAQLIAVVGMSGGLLGLVWGTFIGTLFASILHMWVFRSELTWWFSIDELRKALHLGLPSIPNATFVNVYRYADRVILERFVANEVIGLYFLALRIGDLLKLGIDVLVQAWTPVFFKEASTEAQRPALAQGAALLTIVFGGGALLTVLLGQAYVAGFFDPSYRDAILLIPLVVIAQLLKGMYSFPHLSIWLSKKSYWFPVITVVPMVLGIGANLVAIPEWGAFGAALVMIGGFAIHMLMTYLVGQRLLPLSYRYRIMALTVLAAICATLCVSRLIGETWLWPRLAIGTAAYAVVAYLMVRRVLRGSKVASK